MAINVGAALGGFGEEYARGLNRKTERIQRLTDEAWSDHKNQFQKRRDKEQLKADAAEAAIERLSQLTDGNIDHAASLYNRIGNPEDAMTFFRNGQLIRNQGEGLLQQYIGEMPDDFETSNLTPEDYGRSFANNVRFSEGLSETEKGLGGRLTRRFEILDSRGLAPADFVSKDINFAELSNVNVQSLIVPESSEAVKGLLTNLAINAQANDDPETLERAMEGLNTIDNITTLAGGGDAYKERVSEYNTSMSNYITKQISINRQQLVDEGVISFDPATGSKNILNKELYDKFTRERMQTYSDIYGKDLTGTKLDAFNDALNLTIGIENITALAQPSVNNKPALTDEKLISDINSSGKDAVIAALVRSRLYTQQQAEEKVASLMGGNIPTAASSGTNNTRPGITASANRPGISASPPEFSPIMGAGQ